MLKRIYEHLITKEKYNTLQIEKDSIKKAYDEKVIELKAQENINKIEREKFGQAVEDLTQKLVKEKQKNKELKEKIKYEQN